MMSQCGLKNNTRNQQALTSQALGPLRVTSLLRKMAKGAATVAGMTANDHNHPVVTSEIPLEAEGSDGQRAASVQEEHKRAMR